MLRLAVLLGPQGGQNFLKVASKSAPFFGGKVTCNFNFDPFPEHFDAETEILQTPELATDLRQTVAALHRALQAPAAQNFVEQV